MKLWLDDIRPAPEGWVWAKTYDEAIHHLTSMKTALARETPMPDLGLVSWLEFWTITHMSLDHDLADVHYQTAAREGASQEEIAEEWHLARRREMTGYNVALWMAEHEVWPTEACYVHSLNGVGADNIRKTVDRYGPYATRCVWRPAPMLTITQEQCDLYKRFHEAETEII